MSRRDPVKFVRLGLFALACIDCSIADMAVAADLAIPPPVRHAVTIAQPANRQAATPEQPSVRGPTGSLAASSASRATTPRPGAALPNSSAMGADVAEHARLARARFFILRAAMEREMSLHRAVSADDLSALESAMADLSAELSAVIQSAHAPASNKAKGALELAQDWYQAGLSVINPPAQGVTEIPVPMNVSNKADLVEAALEGIFDGATPSTSAQRSVELMKKPAANGLGTTTSSAHPIPSYASR